MNYFIMFEVLPFHGIRIFEKLAFVVTLFCNEQKCNTKYLLLNLMLPCRWPAPTRSMRTRSPAWKFFPRMGNCLWVGCNPGYIITLGSPIGAGPFCAAGSRIHERKILLRFLGMILRVLIFEVSVEWVKFSGKIKKGCVIIPDDNITW